MKFCDIDMKYNRKLFLQYDTMKQFFEGPSTNQVELITLAHICSVDEINGASN